MTELNPQAMLLEQGYGQQLSGHLQRVPSAQRETAMPPLRRSGGSGQLVAHVMPAHSRLQHPSVRSVYTQTPLEHMGSFEDEPGMPNAHEARSCRD